jgi:stress-induced morphogen
MIQEKIGEVLEGELHPEHLEVINESHKHHVPAGSETHMRVVIVSDKFEKLFLVERHRLINTLLQPLFKEGLHALSIVTKTPGEWASNQSLTPSPDCFSE